MSNSDIRVVSYNCRGWKSGSPFVDSFLNKFDVCFIQEHWLLNEQLSALDFNSDFCSVGVSGMTSSDLIVGRPYGGCGILFRKSLLPVITRLKSNSTRFCTISNSFVTLILCVYLLFSNDLYLETLSEIKGFIDSYTFDNIVVGGDFNVDFQRWSVVSNYLQSFMNDLNIICAVQSQSIQFTYERDGGQVRSWPDHILTLRHLSSTVSDVRCIHSASNFFDHVPLCFSYSIGSLPNTCPTLGLSSSSDHQDNIDWHMITVHDVDRYHQTVLSTLPVLSPELLECSNVTCVVHKAQIDSSYPRLLASLSTSAHVCFPARSKCSKVVPGWNMHVRKFKDSAVFWNTVWVEAGCPSSGVVFDLRKRTKAKYKYAIRKVKRRKDSRRLALPFPQGIIILFGKRLRR